MSESKCDISRRLFLWMTAASAVSFGQGISTRNGKPLPRGKPSGLPFPARFTDVAAQAGLLHPTIYGGLKSKKYIVETVGCGVAFLDYDNDGWLDILVLSGSRMDGPVADSSNRLYKNNRDGTFTDVTEKAGLLKTGWASGVTVGDYNNDGFDEAPICCGRSSEVDFRPELQGARVIGGCDLSEVPVCRSAINILELSVVEGVEGLEA
jgi:hypothetical protein